MQRRAVAECNPLCRPRLSSGEITMCKNGNDSFQKFPRRNARSFGPAQRMAAVDIRCVVVESNFLISLDLVEILQSLGFTHVDHATDKDGANELLQNTSFDVAFIDFDQDEDIARQMASQMRLHDAAIIFTSTFLDQTDMPSGLGEYRLLRKPYSTSVLRDILDLK